MDRHSSFNSQTLLLLALAVSLQLSQGRSAREVAFMAGFFTVLGDNLALLALGLPEEPRLSKPGVSSW